MHLKHIDFFINQKCNLKCKHCYVNPEMDKLENISLQNLKETLTQAINLGVRTIGCTGKEPLLTFERTKEIFEFLYEKKKTNANILYGIVTNGTLLDEKKAKVLNDLKLDYLDISIDGTEEIHDSIRGKGTYKSSMKNLDKILNLNLNHLNKNNIFIDFTLSQTNKGNLPKLITELSKKELQNIYISPYQAIKENDKQILNPKDYLETAKRVLNNSVNYNNMKLYFKNDIATKENIDELDRKEIIDFNNLYKDELGVVYSIIKRNGNKFYFNLLNNSKNFLIRINSNGDLTNCINMFKNKKYKNFGNVKEKPIKQILKPYLNP